MLARHPITLVPRFILLLALVSSAFSAGLVTRARAAEELNRNSLDSRNQSLLSTPILDDFNRADGSLGGNWSGATAGFALGSNQVNVNAGGNIYWQSTAFGVDQEAFVTLTHIDPETPEINLILKGQSNTSSSPGQISVSYSPSGNSVQVWSHQSGIGWQTHDAPIPAVFADGDQFSVKALASGQVEVYKNSSLLAVRSVTDWGYYAQGGYIGFAAFGPGTTTLDNFGGGTIGGSPTVTPSITSTSAPTHTALPTNSGSSFPTTFSLDDFNRTNGPLGGNWSGATSGYILNSSQVNVNTGGNIYWQSSNFGVDQEAFITLTHIDPTTPEINLILKGQSNTSINPGQISISYSPSGNFVQVWSYHTVGGWQTHSTPVPAAFADGDQFGVRALSNGQIEIYKNGSLLAVRNVTDWGYYAQGGYIGFSAFGPGTTTVDNFGGGTVGGSPTMTPAPTLTPTFAPSPLPTSIGGTSFPSTNYLDDFNRTNGSLGGNWLGATSGYALSSNQISVNSGGNMYWQSSLFGVDQEAFVTLTHIDPSTPEINLILKSQNNSLHLPGQISVSYNPSGNSIQVWSHQSGVGWRTHGDPVPVVFTDGDQFGVRALASGEIEIYRNGILIGMRSMINWVFHGQGGYIGLAAFGPGTTTLDNFGGGTIGGSPTLTPTATIPPACTDPLTCDPVSSVHSRWVCNVENCTTEPWIGTVINWPSWAAYGFNARQGQYSRSTFTPEGEPLTPYMGSWADGCRVTAVSGIVLIIEWERGTDVWRATYLQPGQTYTIDLVAPEDNALLESPDTPDIFSVSLSNCTPQNIHGDATPTSVGAVTATTTPLPTQTPSFTPTFTSTATNTSTSTIVPTFTPTPSRTPTTTFTSTPTRTSTLANTATRTSTATNTATRTSTSTATPSYSYRPLYLSLLEGQTVGGVSASNEDILKFDGQTWSIFFDGSDVGASSVDLSAFSILDSDSILMSFRSSLTLNGISVNPQDIVRFDATSLGNSTAGTFSMYFDGGDVGLTTTDEFVDSMDRLADGRLWISTSGDVNVSGVSGDDEDVLAFSPASLGSSTSGTWSMGFDGSDVGLGDEDVDALDVTSNGNIYLSTTGDFALSAVSGADEDVFICVPTSVGNTTACNFSSTLYFNGSTWGLSGNDVDAFNILDSAAAPTATPTNTATRTPTATNTATRTPTATATPSYSYHPLYLSLSDGQTVGGVAVADEDILKFDGQTWSIFFDGSDVGASAVDLSTFSILDSNSILMSFSSAVTLNGLIVNPQDVVRFDASSLGNITTGTFSMYFDGGDVGLTTAEESIDSVDVISGPWLLISTTGSVSVTGVSASDEDILAFSPSSLGSSTSGTWTLGFDGSDVGLGDSSDEDVDALDVVGSNTVYLSTTGDFSVSGVSGSDEDIFICVITSTGSNTACNYSSTLYFNGSTWGLSANDVDAFNFLETGP